MTDLFARPQAPWALRLVPPFPAIAHRILALASQEDVNVQKIGELIRMDPTFSADLLRFANSALFGLRREVTSLSHAILLVGTDRVKTMATFVAINKMVRASMRVQALRKVWVHSLATALISEELARAAGLDPESAYTTGLLHNLGTLGMMSAYPDEYSRLLEVSDEFGLDLLRTERDLFDIDHCAAGAYLAQDWNFPDEIAAAIATHHDDPVAREISQYNVIKLAWRLTDALGFAAFSPRRVWTYEELIAYQPSKRRSWLYESEESAKAYVADRIASAPA
jgi:putative nucleotidyltransferase with HDIG domain